MEGEHLSRSTDPENVFDISSTKEKKKKSEYTERSPDVARTQRHIAQEVMKLDQAETEEPQTKQINPENQEQQEIVSELTHDERQYAAQILRRESQLQRHEVVPDPETPIAVLAGDMLVEEWDERIESGQDFDDAFAKVIEAYNIESYLEDNPADTNMQQPSESSSTHEFPLIMGEEPVVIDHSQSPHLEGYAKHSEDSSTESFERQSLQNESQSADIDWITKTKEAIQSKISPKSTESTNRPYYEQAKPAPTYIRNGIVGNFLGSRRGKVNDEKQLLPVQRDLELAVNDLSWELKAKEAKIRHAAAEYIRDQGPNALEPLRQQFTKVRESLKPSSFAETVLANTSTETYANRSTAPEAKHLHAEPYFESKLDQITKTAEVQPVNANKINEQKRAEFMSRPELLELSGKIEVEGTTLRNVYETHLIGEQALRRLVAEHLNGGDVARALRREIVEHEIDFERDPALRDMAVPGEGESKESSKLIAPGKEALDQLLQKAGEHISEEDDSMNYAKKGNDENQLIQKDTKPRLPQPSNRRAADYIMGSTILALVIAIIILYLLRM